MSDMTKCNQETDYLMQSEANRNHILKGMAEADEADALASKARRELLRTSEVKTVCPKCHQKIQILKEENRVDITCPCHYVSVHEIVF